MIFTAPIPFREALDAHDVKSVLPTTGRTRDLQQLEPAIKRRALFSATVALAAPLEKIRDGVGAILAGQTDQATARLAIKNLWKELGYKPDPTKMGTLQDLASTERIDLQLATNVATARGAGWHQQGMQPDVLDEFPAQELYRATSPEGGAKAERNWAERWEKAGGVFFDGRMIALKTDPVWKQLGSPDLFDDGLGNEWPPFAFNSGMRVRDIVRDEAEALGLIAPNEEQFPQPLDLEADLAAAPALRESWLRSAIEESGLGSFQNGVLVFQGGRA
ncbi:MAG: hypothetical protein JNK23_10620 [Opitutaceae bacterium]|nr:hypothetical protein [Opitutaceae bacterium]